jgi:site-specific DNA-methyltransferase (adenine-specific)
MKSYYTDRYVTIYHGDCREILPQLKGTGIITDPPYELGFMGKSWDKQGVSFQRETWQIIRESCLSGSMLLSFGGTRTFHRIACAIEDAGWELRDTIMWLYGSGFPKSLDISKAIDKMAGARREVIGKYKGASPNTVQTMGRPEHSGSGWSNDGFVDITVPASPEAQLWSGYGTALKPAYEPILVCMNPLDGTFANNALKHGVAGLNIDGCRVGTETITQHQNSGGRKYARKYDGHTENLKVDGIITQTQGRFPANIIHDGSEEVLELFPNRDAGGSRKNTQRGQIFVHGGEHESFGDSGSASRFFYCAKASKSERDRGCEDMYWLNGEPTTQEIWERLNNENEANKDNKNFKRHRIARGNIHPTVKNLDLMKYLVKLISPPKDAVILDPFMGSGTTLAACKELGIKCIGIDIDEYACEIAIKRC